MTVEIITNEGCAKCGMTKNLLASRGISFVELQMGVDVTREQIVARYPMARTFPLIIINDEYIGGFSELLQQITEQGEHFGKQLIQG